MHRWEIADVVLVGVVLAIAAALVLSASCFGLGTLALIRTGRVSLHAASSATSLPVAKISATPPPLAFTPALVSPTAGTAGVPAVPTRTSQPTQATPARATATLTAPGATPVPAGETPAATGDTPALPSDTTVGPTDTPSPTSTPSPQATGGQLVIVEVNKVDEWVQIQNIGTSAQLLDGWTIVSENGSALCRLPAVVLEPGELLRIWTMAQDVEPGDATCDLNGEMWNDDEPDPAVLYDPQGQEIDREPPR